MIAPSTSPASFASAASNFRSTNLLFALRISAAIALAICAACGPSLNEYPNPPVPVIATFDGGDGASGSDAGSVQASPIDAGSDAGSNPIDAGSDAGPLVNGDFEDGGLAGWTSVGVTSISSTAEHGSHAAQIGGAGEGRITSISQTFALPDGADWLSFWVQPSCAGTVQGGAATATLTDSSGHVQTLLAPTCEESQGYLPINVDVSSRAGETVTLLLATEDADAGTPVTLFDNVIVSVNSNPPMPGCDSDSDCSSDQECSAGICEVVFAPVASCSSDIDCGAWQSCLGDSCIDVPPILLPGSGCNSDIDCSGGDVCQGFQCVEPPAPPAQCATDADCGTGICSAGACIFPINSCDPNDPSCNGSAGSTGGSGGGDGSGGCDPSDPTCNGGSTGCDPSDPSCNGGSSGGGGDDGDCTDDDSCGDARPKKSKHAVRPAHVVPAQVN